jgi:hypothetical protein
MTLLEWYALLGKICVYLTLPAAVGFPIWYHLSMRWQRSAMGRHVMGYSCVVALLYLSTLLQFFTLSPVVSGGIGVALAVLMMIVVWWRVLVFIKVKKQVETEKAVEAKARLNRMEPLGPHSAPFKSDQKD